jgi:hypothetical protein
MIFHTLQFLGILPFNFGVLLFYHFDLFLPSWGFMALISGWCMLWNVNLKPGCSRRAFHLELYSHINWLAVPPGGLLPSVLVNGVILIYCLLPGVRQLFGTQAK